MTDFTECDAAFVAKFGKEPDNILDRQSNLPSAEYCEWMSRHEGFRACWQLLQEEIDELKARVAELDTACQDHVEYGQSQRAKWCSEQCRAYGGPDGPRKLEEIKAALDAANAKLEKIYSAEPVAWRYKTFGGGDEPHEYRTRKGSHYKEFAEPLIILPTRAADFAVSVGLASKQPVEQPRDAGFEMWWEAFMPNDKQEDAFSAWVAAQPVEQPTSTAYNFDTCPHCGLVICACGEGILPDKLATSTAESGTPQDITEMFRQHWVNDEKVAALEKEVIALKAEKMRWANTASTLQGQLNAVVAETKREESLVTLALQGVDYLGTPAVGIKVLRNALADANQKNDEAWESFKAQEMKLATAQADLVRMREALYNYATHGTHDVQCSGPVKPCVCGLEELLATPPDRSALDAMLVAAKVEGMQNRWIYFSATEPEYDSRLNAMPFLISWQSRMVTVAYLTKHGWSDGKLEGLSSNNMVAWMSLPEPALLASANCPHCGKDTPHEHFIKDDKCLDQLAAGTPKESEG